MDLQKWIAHHNLINGTLSSSVGICILWADRDKLPIPKEGERPFSLLGNLYTPRGINWLLRSLWLAPKIRYLILWGVDSEVARTGELLAALWRVGIDSQHKIQDTNIQLDPLIPAEAMNHLRQHVTLIGLRHLGLDASDFLDILDTAATLPELNQHAEPQSFPEPEVEPPSTYPSGTVGFTVTTATVAEALPKLLHLIMRYGSIKPTEYGNRQKEIINLTVVVTGENPEELYLPQWLPFSHTELEAYYPEVLEVLPLGEKAYLYGRRLLFHFGIDQIEAIIQRFKKAWYTRRAVAVLWDVYKDNDPEITSPPCTLHLVANVVDGRLYLTYGMRSQEMFIGWAMNTLAMLKWQQKIAVDCGFSLGSITSFTTSAHIYDDKWVDVEQLLRQQHQVLPLALDPAGNFVIRLENSKIVVELISPGTGATEPIWQAEGTGVEELSHLIAHEHPILLPTHFLYLGRELQRAEDALRAGRFYIQEQA